MRTELHFGEARRYARTVILTTTFTMDEALKAYVPATMQEGFTLRDAAGERYGVLLALPAIHGQ